MTAPMSPTKANFLMRVDNLRVLALIACLAYLIVESSSGLKNAVVWGGAIFIFIGHLRSRHKTTFSGLGSSIIIYLLACSISATFSINQSFSFSQLIKLLEMIAGYYLLTNTITSPAKLKLAILAVAVAIGFLALIDSFLAIYAQIQQSPDFSGGRWHKSLLGFPTIASSAYGCGLILLVSCLLRPDRTLPGMKSLLVILTFFTCYILFILQTRSVYAGLFLAFTVMVIFAPPARHRKRIFILTAILIAALPLLIPGSFRDRLLSFDTSDRVNIWSDATREVQSRLDDDPWRILTGFGYGHRIFEEIHGEIPKKERKAARVYDHAHNLYLELFIQSGLIGLLAFLGLLTSVVVKYTKFIFDPAASARIDIASLAGALLMLFVYGQGSLFLASLPALLFWSLLGVFMAAMSNKNQFSHTA